MDERERSAEDVDGEGEVDERAEAEGERRARVSDGRDSSSDDESRTVSADLNPRAVVAISGLMVRDKISIQILVKRRRSDQPQIQKALCSCLIR